MMKILLIPTFFLWSIFLVNCNGQGLLRDKAIAYIEKDTVATKFFSDILDSHPCTIIIDKDTLFGPTKKEIKISKDLILNSPYPCLCGILKARYNFKGKCTEEIGLDGMLAKRVSDSINSEFQNYIFKPQNTHQDFDNKFVLEFSEVYKQTLFVKLRFVCASTSIGNSVCYYFVFDKGNKIKNVFLGKTYY